jgi:hypothetical protein
VLVLDAHHNVGIERETWSRDLDSVPRRIERTLRVGVLEDAQHVVAELVVAVVEVLVVDIFLVFRVEVVEIEVLELVEANDNINVTRVADDRVVRVRPLEEIVEFDIIECVAVVECVPDLRMGILR